MKITVIDKQTGNILGIYVDEQIARQHFNDVDCHFIIEPVTDSEIAEQSKINRKQQQMSGIEFDGVMCSATGDDQSGLSALLLKHTVLKLNGLQLPDIHFRFENGEVLTINAGNIEALDAIWTPFRLSFFPPQ